MHYQNQGLPVPVAPLNPHAGAGMQGLPYNPPFVVPIQLSQPQLTQMAPFITGAVLMEILNNAQKNNLRCFFANLMSNNGWQTQELQRLVQQAAYIAEYLMIAKNMRPEQAIPSAATEAVVTTLAQVVFQYQQMGLAEMIDHQMAANLNESLQRAQMWEQELRTFQQNLGARMGGMGGVGMGGGMMPANTPAWAGMNSPSSQFGGVQGGYPPAGNRGGPIGTYGMGGGTQFNAGAYAMRSGSGGMYSNAIPGHGGAGAGTPAAAGMGSGMKPAKRRIDNTMLTMEPDGKRTVERWDSGEAQQRIEYDNAQNNQTLQRFPVRGAGQPMDAFPSTTTAPAFVAAETAEKWPKFVNPENPYRGMDFEDGTQMRLAFESGWTVTLTPENPYRTIYDPTQFVLYHLRRPDGTVIERLEPWTEEMQSYIDHETDPKLRTLAREQAEANDEKIVVPTWNLAEHLRGVKDNFKGIPADSEPSGEEGEETTEAEETHVVEQVLTVHSRREAELKLGMFARSQEIKPGTPVEFQFDVVTTVVTDSDLIPLVAGLEKAMSFEEVLSHLQELDDKLPEDVLQLIDARMTAEVNQTLQQNFSLDDLSIDSFREDYQDLLKVLGRRGGETLVDLFAERAPAVIGSSLSVLTGDAYLAYLKTLGEDETATVLAFRDRCSMTQVPWNFADLHLNLNGGGMIPEAAMPELHAAVAAIFARTEDWPVNFAHRYLMTADKKLIELRQGCLGSEAFLMFEAK